MFSGSVQLFIFPIPLLQKLKLLAVIPESYIIAQMVFPQIIFFISVIEPGGGGLLKCGEKVKTGVPISLFCGR